MVKRKRFSNNPKVEESNKKPKSTAKIIQSPKPPMDVKSIILSGTKYVYILAAAALLSGIFTPLTIGIEIEVVIIGILSILLGLGGGIVIFLAIKNQELTTVMICAGLTMMVISLILIYETAENSLFG